MKADCKAVIGGQWLVVSDRYGLFISLFRLETAYRFYDLRQLREQGRILQPGFVIDGGCATDQRAGGDVVGDSALRSDDCAVAYFAVSDDSDLPRENHLVADLA